MFKKTLCLLASFTLLVACTKTNPNNRNSGDNILVSNSNVGMAMGYDNNTSGVITDLPAKFNNKICEMPL